tara:strand:+ start:2341 stop:3375 length:1035 start_codon:yes stop_codon:yes gene_type:complete
MVSNLNTIQKDDMKRVTIIAEAGVNHNGSIDMAKKLIDVAADAGADFVKFQTFKAKTLVTKFAEKAEYQNKNIGTSETHYSMLKKYELSEEDHNELIKHSFKNKIKFLSTGFDIDSINLLIKLKTPILKIPSGEITNLPLLRHVAKQKKEVILSTGMSSMIEIKNSVEALMDNGLRKNSLTVLHCNTEYPTPMDDVNLRAMLTIKNELNVKVGYSDHTLGIEVPIAAVAMGALVIEKHFTLDRNLPGPDHPASLLPEELSSMVIAIRNIEKSLGDGVKKPSPSEVKNIKVARKSIVAKTSILEGDVFSEKNITVKRPGDGISPMKWDQIIGKVSTKKYFEGDLI